MVVVQKWAKTRSREKMTTKEKWKEKRRKMTKEKRKKKRKKAEEEMMMKQKMVRRFEVSEIDECVPSIAQRRANPDQVHRRNRRDKGC